MNEQEARKRVKQIKEFYSHLITYLCVNVGLIAINLVTSPDEIWFIWPLLGWGLGLLGHAADVFGVLGISTRGWEERKVRELMQQDERAVSLEQVQHLVDRELREARRSDRETPDLARLLQRVENLEAIVTSKDWDMLREAYHPSASIPDEPGRTGSLSDEQKAADLARRVR